MGLARMRIALGAFPSLLPLGAFPLLLLPAACAPQPSTPAQPLAPNPAAAVAPPAPAELGPDERCARGDLTACADLAWARTKSIRTEEHERGAREIRSLCERGLALACARSGDLAWGNDKPAAKQAYERGCALGSALACASLGLLFDAEQTGSPEARRLLEKACDEGSPEGCTWLAQTLRPDKWTEEAIGRYWSLMTRGCSGRVAAACRALGRREQAGDGVPRDAVAAATHFEIACEGRDAAGCVEWGAALERGVGTTQDEKGAVRAYSIACDGGDTNGCFRLAQAYLHGVGVEKDPPRASVLFVAACKRGDLSSCLRLGADADLEPDRARRLATLDGLCSASAMAACESLGRTLSWQLGDERSTALAKLEDACAAGRRDACFSGYYAAIAPARRKKTKGPVPAALAFLDRACDRDEPGDACYVLADQWMSGEHVPRDPKRGGALAVALCERDASACAMAGEAWERGLGVPADVSKGAAAYEKGCDAGLAKACRALAKLVRSGRGVAKDAARAEQLARKADDIEEDE